MGFVPHAGPWVVQRIHFDISTFPMVIKISSFWDQGLIWILGSQHIAYVFVYHGVTSLENTPQPMQLCFYFTLSAKKLFQWIFFWLSPFFQRKTMDAYNFLDTDTTFANFFCKITTKWSKTFLCKKRPSEIQHHHDCFCNLESWNKGALNFNFSFLTWQTKKFCS